MRRRGEKRCRQGFEVVALLGGRSRQQANKIEQSHHITTVLTFLSAMILLPSGSVDISSHSNGVRGYIPPHDSHVWSLIGSQARLE